MGVLLEAEPEPCEERTEEEGESSAMVAGGERVSSSECVRACGRAGGERACVRLRYGHWRVGRGRGWASWGLGHVLREGCG